MEKENTARNKSKRFAVRIVNLYKFLCEEKKEFVLSKQLLRCGTSIGANLAEAEYGISTKDFLSKVYISLKECAETVYWLELLFETKYINDSEYHSINDEALELLKILKATTKTVSQKLNSTL
ncbi:MAG: four helix bundle protein [Dysgonamonadaceae bacterium]|jgi:four helix bundle protein|nr:four helix bundle protein [Dysgonamonadaceae bacterium]